MKFVEILKTQNDGSQQVVATCKLIGGKVVCEGGKGLIENLKNDGILDYSKNPPMHLYPKDGLLFLETLNSALVSGYLNATTVKDDGEN